MQWSPLAVVIPTTGGATRTEVGSGEPSPAIQYADAAQESAYLDGVLVSYGGNGLTVHIWWRSPATANDVIFRARVASHTLDADDLDSDTFGAWTAAAASTAPSAAGELQRTAISITDGTNLDSLADGEHFRIEVQRNGTDGSDDLTDVVDVVHYRVFET